MIECYGVEKHTHSQCEWCRKGGFCVNAPTSKRKVLPFEAKQQPPGNPAFQAVLAKMKAIHESKSHDYASSGNPFSNFELAANIAGITVEQGMRFLCGIKLARLLELEDTGKVPNNESIADSEFDLATYAALKAAYRIYKQGKLPPAAEATVQTG